MPRADELITLIRRYKTEDGARARLTLERIMTLPDAPHRIFGLIFSEDCRAALRALADLCRKKVVREEIAPLVAANADKLMALEDDKARKTAYVLIGLCAPDASANKLLQALKNEKTRFVRPSIILALGNTKTPAEYLSGYVIEPGDPKHVNEEREALKKALGKATASQPIKQLQLPEWSTVTLISKAALTAEAKAHGVQFRESAISGLLDVKTADLTVLRCYENALYDIGAIGEFEKAAKVLDSLGCSGFRYRVEAGELPADQRRDAIRTISEGMGRFGYEDNPSGYAFEIRLMHGHMLALFPGDSRFAYRKQAIPASINPVTAASIMRLCRSYMREGANVLDPFCGSGTMLIERAMILPAQSLVGVDISPAAIRAACENRKASGRKIALIQGDALQFGASRYDEVISNMPFGIRVSRHAENERLYALFIEKLVKLLEEGGHAFLYTLEKKLLRESLRGAASLKILNEVILESGGLSPSLYILKKERNI